MEYRRRNVSLPPHLDDKLRKEVSASGIVQQALEAYYNHKQTMVDLANKVDTLNSHLERLQPPSSDRYQMKVLVPGKPAVKVDTEKGLYYDPYIEEWKSIGSIE